MDTNVYFFKGTLEARSALTVSRAGDSFYPKDEIRRIPRSGPKTRDTLGYWPAGSIEGALRRMTRNVLRKKEAKRLDVDAPLSIETNYLLSSGVLKDAIKDTSGLDVVPGKSRDLRNRNPGLSLHGRWGLAANFMIDNGYSDDKDDIALFGEKYRQNEYIRSPEEVEKLSEDDQERLEDVLKDEITAISETKVIRGKIEEAEARFNTEIDDKKRKKIASEIEKLKNQKKDKEPSVMRPVSPYEAFRKGARLRHKMTLSNGTELELGLVLATLREFARFPFMGSSKRDHCGEVAGEYEVVVWPEDSDSRVLGVVRYEYMQFEIDDDNGPLTKALAHFDEVAKDFETHGIDISAAV